MSALAVAEWAADAALDASARSEDAPEGLSESFFGGLSEGLAARLFAAALTGPQRTVLRDSGDRVAWCGRPAITWTYAAAAEIVGRLARGIGAWRLPAGSRIGLWFSGGAESTLAHLAVEAAGHLPCAMPAVWDCAELSAGIESAGLVAVLTEGRRGARRPAEDLTRAAMRHFGLRYLAAFGPSVPDGVISLDAMALERGVVEPAPSRGLVTFAGGDPGRPVYRSAAALAAAIAAHLDALPLSADERVLTLLPGHDLRGLVTGLGAALAAGAGLETVLPFDEAGFRAALLRPVPTRLVVPALVESAIAALPLPWTVRVLDVVHRAPARLTRRSAGLAGPQRLDSLVLGEALVLTRPGLEDLAATLAHPEDALLPRTLLDVGHGPAGGLGCRGPACAAQALPRSGNPETDPRAWRDSGYRLLLSGGTAVAVAAT
ncbi:acyl-CoA synthetase [Methylobacterium sp. 092160098-2]|uniref:Acyl-CoA synthetase (AMP-forming)/AMP-acid ligase II n=1 Tax=Methylobacterium fujisawaense TaxID=107400 RepID=A0ABR6DB33_9HYPH|nr:MULTISPECIES: acyl-CoA synthetase [unclassified Methylobacterium]MBA9063290.1 acyl-CoA synthetase (AMP-forming)/AMP-acid ligase II [Methylobacterium fujisawaense]MDE4913632.1 acyl-CoA synthetase [Methylobacterium sp. 092160098-2]